MTSYIIRRLLSLIFVLFGISIIVFGIMMSFGPERRAAAYITSPQQINAIPEIIESYGLDDPFFTQYIRWIKEIGSGNFGWSRYGAMPVLDALLTYLPVTIELNLFAAPLTIILGIWLGTRAGIHKNTLIDHVTRITSVIGWSLPTFLFGLILLMVFYGLLQWFPPGVLDDSYIREIIQHPSRFTAYTGMYTVDGVLNGRLDITLNALKHLVLPVITQVVVVVAVLVRVMRSSMIEEMSKEFVLTARAKGADVKTVNLIHAKKNALIPAVTVAGWLVALSLQGSIAVEIIFNRPGIGQWTAASAIALEMAPVMGMCVFLAIIYLTANLIIDILYAVIDPRIRLE